MSGEVSKGDVIANPQSLQAGEPCATNEAGNMGPVAKGAGGAHGRGGPLGRDHISLSNFSRVQNVRCGFCTGEASYEVVDSAKKFLFYICVPCLYNLVAVVWSLFDGREMEELDGRSDI